MKGKEWAITSATEEPPRALSEVAILTDEEELYLDQIVGEDISVELTNLAAHFNQITKTICIRSLDDIIALFHEIGHAVAEPKDPVINEIARKIEGRIRNGISIPSEVLEEIQELVMIRGERVATAYALKKLRYLQKEKGIDVFRGLSNGSVVAIVNNAIASHFARIKDTPEYRQKLNDLLKERIFLVLSKPKKK